MLPFVIFLLTTNTTNNDDNIIIIGNFGLNVASGVMSGWIHGCNPLQQLDAEYYLEKLKKDLEKGDHFQKLIREHLINNTHQVTLGMSSMCVFSWRFQKIPFLTVLSL